MGALCQFAKPILTHSAHFRKNITLMLIQIQRWLMQPELWRLVGFASTVVGLSCYALSSSFNHLLGEWNLLKIFVYSVFSIIMCLATLFAKIWQHSTNLRLKAHLAFVVLAITSVYSFFFDKAVTGKPDAYSLISCAAFAITSLSLSRQTRCGFEVDLLYFFLGSLIIQLMKIKLWLGIVGGGFSYSLMILRSSLDATPETETGYAGLQDHVMIQVDANTAGGAIQVNSPESNTGAPLVSTPQEGNTDSAPIAVQSENGYLVLHDHVVTQVDSQHANPDSALVMPQLMDCINALKKKNRTLIRMLSKYVDEYLKANVNTIGKRSWLLVKTKMPRSPQLDHNLVMDVLPSEIINKLHVIMKLMGSAGFEKECCNAYSSCRREFIQQCLSQFGLQVQDTDDIDKMGSIERWIKASNIALRILFPNERTLCDRVFFGLSSTADLSFMQVCRELTIHLLNFANKFAIGSCSPNLLHGTTRVFETLRHLIPEFQSLFFDEYSVSLKNEAIAVSKRLSEAMRAIFMDLENLIRCDTAEAVIPGGLYPITHDVMKWLSVVLEARDTIKQVFREYPMDMVADREGPSSSLSVQLASIIDHLLSHLEAKSKNCTHPALGYVFMINNGMYILHMGSSIHIRTILGRDWIRKLTDTVKVRQNFEYYLRSSWNKLTGLLKLDSNEAVEPNVAAESMKEKLCLFNMQFKEICSVQSTWFVVDERLREEIRISLENILLPAYGNFIGKFQNVLGKYAFEYIEYGMFDIQARLNDLFHGGSGLCVLKGGLLNDHLWISSPNRW